MNNNWKKDRIGAAHSGENPLVLAKMRSGFAVIGDTQFLPGYCVLLPLENVKTLNDLNYIQRSEFLLDMSLLGDAVQQVCSPRRINYSIYGNSDAFLHSHIFPRYDWEPEERIPYPVWQYPGEKWTDKKYQFSEEHADLKDKLSRKIQELMKLAY